MHNRLRYGQHGNVLTDKSADVFRQPSCAVVRIHLCNNQSVVWLDVRQKLFADAVCRPACFEQICTVEHANICPHTVERFIESRMRQLVFGQLKCN